MKTKLTTLIVVLAASIAQAGQPTSAAELAKNSRKPTAAEMQNKGSGVSSSVGKAICWTATKFGVNPNWAPMKPFCQAR